MATFRTVRMSFWEDVFVSELTLAQRYFYLYLFTSCASNIGVLERAMRRIEFDTTMSKEEIEDALAFFEAQGKIVRDGQQVLILNFIKNQTTRAPRVIAGLISEFRELRSTKLRAALVDKYPDLFGDEPVDLDLSETYSITSETNSKPIPIEQETNSDIGIGKGKGKSNSMVGEQPAADSPPLEADASAPPQTALFDSACSLEEVATLWNEMMPHEGFSAVKMNLLSKDRRKHLRARQRTFPASRDIDFWRKVFTVLLRSSFLRGDKSQWRATFDFCIESDQKLRKIVEGVYDDKCVVETWLPYEPYAATA